jgi:tRNA(adenine34) deaminase
MINPFDDTYFMKKALQEAEIALAKGEVPVGAVIVCNNQIIAKGHNQVETLQDATAHAEMLAFTAATHFLGSKYLKDCTLYVSLEPCQMCAGAAFWSQIGRIVYGASDEKRGYKHWNCQVHPKTEVKSGVLATESEALLNKFFEKMRSKK